jgi:hypothetical protein
MRSCVFNSLSRTNINITLLQDKNQMVSATTKTCVMLLWHCDKIRCKTFVAIYYRGDNQGPEIKTHIHLPLTVSDPLKFCIIMSKLTYNVPKDLVMIMNKEWFFENFN